MYVGCVWFTDAMRRRETYKRRKTMLVEVREFWLLLGGAAFFATTTFLLTIWVSYLLSEGSNV